MTEWLAGVVKKVLNARIKIIKRITAKDEPAIILSKSDGETVYTYLKRGGVPCCLDDYLKKQYIIVQFPERKD